MNDSKHNLFVKFVNVSLEFSKNVMLLNPRKGGGWIQFYIYYIKNTQQYTESLLNTYQHVYLVGIFLFIILYL